MRLVGLLLAAISGALVGFLLGIGVASAAPPKATPLHYDEPRAALIQVPPPIVEYAPALLRGSATWCAPTPRHCQNWTRPKLLGAVESFRWGDKPYRATVWHGTRHVTVTVVSHCACGGTLIDLSVAAFERLAPLSKGRIDVRVEPVGDIRLPATDVP